MKSTFELLDYQSGNLIYYGTLKGALELVAEIRDRDMGLGRYRGDTFAIIAEGEELLAMAKRAKR